MATVTSNTGAVYHLFGLRHSIKDVDGRIAFSELENQLGDSFFSQRLIGSATGNRSWFLSLPSLTDTTSANETIVGVNGETTSKARYIWNLFCACKRTGKPFVIEDPMQDGLFFMCTFADVTLSMKRFLSKLFSTGIELKQRRIPGETVFDVSDIGGLLHWLDDGGFAGSQWTDAAGNATTGNATGDVIEVSAEQNGLDVVRFSNSSNNGLIQTPTGSVGAMYEFFLVMKMREATFSNAAGIITGKSGASPQILIGSSGTTKFANPSLSGFLYRLNGVEFAQSDMQAPMNEWGIVHVRYETGWSVTTTGWQYGQNRTTSGTFAEMDIGEVLGFSQLISEELALLITEHLQIKWGIGT